MKLSLSANKTYFPITDIWQGSFKELMCDISNYLRSNSRQNRLIFTPNLDHLKLLNQNNEFKKKYSKADWIATDGISLIWLSRLAKNPIRERINGTNLMFELIKICDELNLKIFFLGSTKSNLKKLSKNLKNQYPDLKFLSYSPPFQAKFNKKALKKMVDKINRFKTDVLFVGLGMPKQEIFLIENKNRLKIRLGMGVGGSFDFLSGTKKRAPIWIQKIGFEWLFRLVQDPIRLGKRYLLQDLPFFICLMTKLFLDELKRNSTI